jgi:hypothetical protein
MNTAVAILFAAVLVIWLIQALFRAFSANPRTTPGVIELILIVIVAAVGLYESYAHGLFGL